MKTSLKMLLSLTCVVLSACSSQAVKQTPPPLLPPAPAPAAIPKTPQLIDNSGQNPAMTITKDGKTLNLVRIMDGAACKSIQEGAKGAFLLYAEPSDIARIKREKGTKIFAEFESRIQTFATEALQNALDDTNLSADPFALGNDQAQEKLAKQLAVNFNTAIAESLLNFHHDTTLTIDVSAFQPSFVFFQNGCELTTIAPDNQGTENTAP